MHLPPRRSVHRFAFAAVVGGASAAFTAPVAAANFPLLKAPAVNGSWTGYYAGVHGG